MADQQAKATEQHNRLRIGYVDEDGKTEHTLGVIALDDQGQIQVESGDHERLARLLASMFHDRYADETALFASLPQRLNNGYMFAHPVTSGSGLKKTGRIRSKTTKKD